MEVEMVFQDGGVFPAAVLDIQDSVLMGKFLAGVNNMAAFSRELGVPTEAGLPHAFGNAFKNVAALVGEVDFDVKELEDVKKFFADPDAYAAANPAASSGGPAPAAAATAGAAAAAAPVE